MHNTEKTQQPELEGSNEDCLVAHAVVGMIGNFDLGECKMVDEKVLAEVEAEVEEEYRATTHPEYMPEVFGEYRRQWTPESITGRILYATRTWQELKTHNCGTAEMLAGHWQHWLESLGKKAWRW